MKKAIPVDYSPYQILYNLTPEYIQEKYSADWYRFKRGIVGLTNPSLVSKIEAHPMYRRYQAGSQFQDGSQSQDVHIQVTCNRLMIVVVLLLRLVCTS